MYKYPNGDKVTTNNSECGNPIATKLPECDGISQIYLSSGLQVQNIEQSDGVFHVYATSSSEEGICPYCGHESKKVHSRYVRVIHDLSILGHRAIIYLGIVNAIKPLLPSSQELRCSAIAGAPVDVRLPLPGKVSRHHQTQQADFCLCLVFQ